MIPLSKELDNIKFDALLEMARQRLPALAKQWTDYNYHDPGIMLIELMAWLADSQVYSLARNRRDEQLGFLGLMGSRARGARPAKGMVVPTDVPDAVRPIKHHTVMKPARGGAPRLEAGAEITLLPVTVLRVTAGAELQDVTSANARRGAAFAAFGPEGGGELMIELDASEVPAGTGPVRLSLGFRVAGSRPDAPVQRVGRIGAYRPDGTPLPRLRDTTFALQRSGVMVFALDAADLAQPIVLRPQMRFSFSPRLIAILPNALPVAQRANLTLTAEGNARPGQTIDIEPATLFDPDEAGQERPWRLVDGVASLAVPSLDASGEPLAWQRGRLDEAEPADRRFAVSQAIDATRLTLRFGNGINGQRPALRASLTIRLALSCGFAGNIAQPTRWVAETDRTRWQNLDPITGGADPETPDTALGALREHIASHRPLATSSQIEAAALALPPALGVARAHVEAGWQRGRRKPATPATRTLIVARTEPGSEDAAWLSEIRRRLVARIAAGERLLVVAPQYQKFTLAIALVATRGSDPARVAAAASAAVADRFDPDKHPWPFGRDVSATIVAGWARNVEGVTAVLEVTLSPSNNGILAVARDALPLLAAPPTVSALRPAA
ncbi:MAG: hypothetical protein ACK5SX_01015 [Sandaracinobacter sp.]